MIRVFGSFVLYTALYLLLGEFTPYIQFNELVPAALVAGVILALYQTIVVRVLKLVLFPVQLLTFGFFGAIIAFIGVYIPPAFVDGMSYVGFQGSLLVMMGVLLVETLLASKK